MPRVFRVRASRPPLSEPARRWFLYGERPKHDEPGFEDEALFDACYLRPVELWRENREALMREFIEAHPGQRPYSWWAFDCPRGAARLKVSGSGAVSAVRECEGVDALCDCEPEAAPCIESVPAFLKRLGLLLPGEEKRIPKRAWRPVRLEVDPEGWAPAGAGGWTPDAA